MAKKQLFNNKQDIKDQIKQTHKNHHIPTKNYKTLAKYSTTKQKIDTNI